MDANNYVTAPTLKKQTIATQTQCTVKDMVGEGFDRWLTSRTVVDDNMLLYPR